LPIRRQGRPFDQIQADVPFGKARASDLRARGRAKRWPARLGAEENSRWRGGIIFGPGRLLAHGVEIDQLARAIAGLPAITSFNRIVVDETTLEGRYDFDFKFSNDFAGRGGPFPGGPPPAGASPAPAPGDEPTLVTAMQEQLGLKLDPRRATVDVLVIDSVEKPSEN
jgi:uncharacterized protein (TIGR03435 family)